MDQKTGPVVNRILSARRASHNAIDFKQFSANDYLPALENAIAEAANRIAAIKAAPASFAQTIVGIEETGEDVDFIYQIFTNLLLAESSIDIRDLAQILGPKVSDFFNDILLDSKLFAKVKEVFERRSQLNLGTEDDQLLDRIYSDFQRRGALLGDSDKQRLRAIDQELSRLRPRFSDNVLSATNDFKYWIADANELSGLPDSFREAAMEAAKEAGREGHWLLTLHAPSILPVLKFSDVRPLREKLWRAYNTRAFGGEHDNQKIILEIVGLMNEKAVLLGYDNHAHFALEKRMAENTQAVAEFLNRLLKAALPMAQTELAEVQHFASSLGGPAPLQPWDFVYYAEKLKEQRYAFDEEMLRPYFPLASVVAGVMEHARRLYGIVFEKSDKYPVYHADVEVYEVRHESPTGPGEFVGLFYADFFPRPGKNQGAWMTNYLGQGPFHGEPVRPHVSIVCNFTKPTLSKPALLSLDEVQTLFHEFGHSLHSLLSTCKHQSLSGTNVYLDFVELPSQIMENWILERESLQMFAKHYFTREELPDDLVEKIRKSDRYLAGYYCLRQLTFSFLDLAWYSTDPKTIADVQSFEQAALLRTRLLPVIPNANISCQFTHIFSGGYSAGYYSYKWAEALDADAFEMFKQKGIFNREVARSFLDNVLSKGGSEHPMRLYERFRGRKPDPDALLRRDGMI